MRVIPGRKLTKAFMLAQEAGNHQTWICSDTGEATFSYEAWCDEPSLMMTITREGIVQVAGGFGQGLTKYRLSLQPVDMI